MKRSKISIIFLLSISLTANSFSYASAGTVVTNSQQDRTDAEIKDPELKTLWAEHKELLKTKAYYELLKSKFTAIDTLAKANENLRFELNNIDPVKDSKKFERMEKEISTKDEALKAARKDLLNSNKDFYIKEFGKDAENIFSKDFKNYVYNYPNESYNTQIISKIYSKLRDDQYAYYYQSSINYSLYKSRLKLIEKYPDLKKILPVYEKQQKMAVLNEEVKKMKAKVDMMYQEYIKSSHKSSFITVAAIIILGATIYFLGTIAAPVVAMAYLIGAVAFAIINQEKWTDPSLGALSLIVNIVGSLIVLIPQLSILLGKKLSGEENKLTAYNRLDNELNEKSKQLEKLKKDFEGMLYNSTEASNAIDKAVEQGDLSSALRLAHP